ncbi:hypothetical protein BGW36DRAFT_332033 [Talaromyces proteolyticus]|uniref:Zn(2)-C6 fungal-type domain-containing protein n=1 Tax=Talaromyces proteolyticus TaxID=1131652 RepID=A0AAD4Q0X3_9EURO|nr:uncharacterized protein BGW36DRAFT_332033 [Talaromyces proteolyticus]KAH8704980.1 hypothetical protein BGW36DRAFT_332033 [Talaromyces proteolyticus]
MVGVPRSKGCSVCRNRRVKCDEARPECGQCRRYGCQCPGYNRGLKFQDEGPGLQRRHRRVSDRRASDATKKPLLDLTENTTSSSSSSTTVVKKRHSGALIPQVTAEEALVLMRAHAGSIDENLSPSLIQKLFVSQQPRLFMDFVCAAFPTLFFHNKFRSEVSFPEYIMQNFNIRAHQDSAVCCLSAVYLASLTGDSRLLRASRYMYGNALRKVNQALDTDEALSDILLSTVMMLTIYEIYAQTTPNAWIKHARGVKEMFLKRGAKRHMSGFGRSCYYAYRGFLVAHAMYEGIPCFLDQDEWQDFAAKVQEEDSKKPGEWSVFVHLSEMIFMELVKCPRYVYDFRHLPPTTPRIIRGALIARIRESCTTLRQLSDELQASIMYHFQKKQGIEVNKEGFVGPPPAVFADTNPTLLLQGATHCINALEKLLRSADVTEDEQIYLLKGISNSPESARDEYLSPTPSADSTCETVSSGASPATVDSSSATTTATTPASSGKPFTLPLRMISEFNRGPSAHGKGGGSHRPVVWLDRIACSMGMIGADIVEDDLDATQTVRGEDLETVVEVIEE